MDLCFLRDSKGITHRLDELFYIGHMLSVALFLSHMLRIAFLNKLFRELLKPERMRSLEEHRIAVLKVFGKP